MRLMLLILLTMAAGGGIGAGVGSLATAHDESLRDHTRRLERNRILGAFAGAGTGFVGWTVVLWRRTQRGATDSGFFLGD